MSKIILGYLFVFFHIKLNGFDILVDCVGFFFIWQGLCAYELPRFVQARPWALALGAINILGIFGGVSRVFSFAPLSAAANLVTVGMSLYLLWLIVQGVGELAALYELPLPVQELSRVWKVQTGASVAGALLVYIPIKAVLLIASVALLIGVAANVLYLIHLYKTRKLLDEAAAQQ